MMMINNTKDALLKAFEGECINRCRYEIYASIAKKEGYQALANNLLELSNNELEHAKLLLALLGKPKNTKEALSLQADTENYEWTINYRSYASIAEKENNQEAKKLFTELATIEEHHEQILRTIISYIKNKELFDRKTIEVWVCSNCGYVHIGNKAPDECPVCEHDRGYFKIQNNK